MIINCNLFGVVLHCSTCFLFLLILFKLLTSSVRVSSDWNPHADLQAMARAHRLGQTNKVMIYRLITRGTIEERMMQMTKKKMILEHLVVGKLKTQNINQEELDDIIRYGSKELFADENDEAGKSRQIHYDDAAIDRLLDRDHVDAEEASLDDEEEDGFLKAFKVANFEYIDEADAIAEEKAQKAAMENKSSMSNSERSNFWEELLKDSYEVHKVEEFSALGKGKRSRKQMVSVEEDDLAGLEGVSSEGEDDNYEADLTDGDTTSSGTQRRPYRKRARGSSEPAPLMEGEGRSFRVLGFNQNQRATFVQILMRFGLGDFDWKEFVPRLKQKTFEEIRDYGTLFLRHVVEDLNDSPTFSDGVPKEGLRIPDVLVRIAILTLIQERIQYAEENPGSPLYGDDIVARYPALKGGKFWKEEHDLILLRAVLKHGYGRWQAIVDDKDLRIQEVICKELNLPFINLPAPGQSSSQTQNGATTSNVEGPGNNSLGAGDDRTTDMAQGPVDPASHSQLYQDPSILYHFRDMQRRQVEFVKKRVLLLEKGHNAEYQKIYDAETGNSPTEVAENVPGGSGVEVPSTMDIDDDSIDQLPALEVIAPEDFSLPGDSERTELAVRYNEMCKILDQNVPESAQAYLNNPVNPSLRKSLQPLETLFENISVALSPNLKQSTTQQIDLEQATGAGIMIRESMEQKRPGDSNDEVEPDTSLAATAPAQK